MMQMPGDRSGGALLAEAFDAPVGQDDHDPPGAIDESQFTGVCLRCGNCARSCPSGIIRPDLGEQGVAGFLTPVLRFDKDYCREDCHQCTQVCPNGALRRMSLEEKQAAPIGLAEVDMDTCIINEASCSLCIGVCPYEAILEDWDEEGYETTIVVDASKCPGCGACEVSCPTEPHKAIVVRQRGKE